MKTTFYSELKYIFLLMLVYTGSGALAQDPGRPQGIVSDGSTGTVVSGSGAYTITGGDLRGGNLFHSFGKFNLHSGTPNDESAFFNDSGVSSTLTRVTGSDYSWINGELISSSNTFILMNPNGIMFGEKTSLTTLGNASFTSADYLRLGDGTDRYYADPGQSSSLTTAHPEAFGFLDSDIAGISVDGGELDVPDDQSLSLIGGDISINNARLIAPGGDILLGSFASPGEAVLAGSGLDVSSFSALSDITLNDSTVDVSGSGSGNFHAYSNNFTATNGAGINAVTNGDQNGGTVSIEATDTIEFNNDSAITSGTEGQGDGGDVILRAANAVRFDSADIDMWTRSTAADAGNAGTLEIEANTIEFHNDSTITSDTDGGGLGGNVSLRAANVVDFDNSQINVATSGTGNAGDMVIVADTIEFRNNSVITSDTYGPGDGGNVMLRVANIAGFDNSRISVGSTGTGNAGDLLIESDTIEFQNDSAITSDTYGPGNGGSVMLRVANIVGFDNSRINVATSGTGNAGNLEIEADTIEFRNDSAITSGTVGPGNGGDVTLHAENAVRFDAADIDMWTLSTAADSGDAGTLEIEADTIEFHNKSTITANTYGGGDSGSVNLSAAQTVRFDNTMIDMTSRSTGAFAGDAGTLEIEAETIEFSNGSAITADSYGGGNAGEIELTATRKVRFDDTQISMASHGTRPPGELVIDAPCILGDFEVAGTVVFDSDRNSSSSSDISGAASLVKDGSGILNLYGDGTYTGDTTVRQGTLRLKKSGSLLSQGTITTETGTRLINNGTLINNGVFDNTAGSFENMGTYQGTGAFFGTLDTGSGVVSPGNSAGTMTVNGDYLLGGNGTLEIEIGGFDLNLNQHDFLDITGTAFLTGGTIELSFLPFYNITTDVGYGQTEFLPFLEADGGIDYFCSSITYDFLGTPDGFLYDVYQDGNSLWFSATNTNTFPGPCPCPNPGPRPNPNPGPGPGTTEIPAPGAMALAGIGAGLVHWLRRRRAL